MDKQFSHPSERLTEAHVKQMALAFDYWFNQPQGTPKNVIVENKKEEPADDDSMEGKINKKLEDTAKEVEKLKVGKKDDNVLRKASGKPVKDPMPDDVDEDDEQEKALERERARKKKPEAKDPKADNVNYKKDDKKKVAEGKSKFETHVICGKCGSHDLTLSEKKTKIKCDECGNVDLLENVVGVK